MMDNRPEDKLSKHFGEVLVDKSLMEKAGFGTRSVPTYVGEWIIDRFCPSGVLDDEARSKIQQFIRAHLPSKDQRESLKNRLAEGETLTIMDEFSVTVDLDTNVRKLRIPSLDIENGRINKAILDQYPLLLIGGMWGAGKLVYMPPSSEASHAKGEVRMIDFSPMQIGALNLDYFCTQRAEFSLEEWCRLLMTSIGYNPEAYDFDKQLLLLGRLVPLVQSCVNLIELAPKGTGKSFVFLNLSRYARLLSGGKVTAAVLFYNNATRIPGLLTRYDVVVFDEVQTLSFDNPGEVIGVLKDYMESGRFSRGRQQASAEASIVMLANVPLDSSKHPANEILFTHLPAFLQETAFIDRLHGILPGWELPRVTPKCLATGPGFKADFFGEVIHELRRSAGYIEYVNAKCKIGGDIRDKRAVERMAAGYLKLLYPHLQLTEHELFEYCIEPARRFRQLVRDQLSLMDPEFERTSILISKV